MSECHIPLFHVNGLCSKLLARDFQVFGCVVNPSEEKTLYASRVVSVEPAPCQSAKSVLHLYCLFQRLLCCI